MKGLKLSSFQINLDDLEALEIENYKSNMINEYTLNLVIERSKSLKEITLSNI
jgi:hypothetical protein